MFQEFPPSRRISPQSAALSLGVHVLAISGLIAVFAAPSPQVRVRPLNITLIAPVLDPAPRPRTEIRRIPPAPVPAPPPVIADAPRAFRLPPAQPKPAPVPAPVIEAPHDVARMLAPAPELARTATVLPPP